MSKESKDKDPPADSESKSDLCDVCNDARWDTTCAGCDKEICDNCESIEEPGVCVECEGEP